MPCPRLAELDAGAGDLTGAAGSGLGAGPDTTEPSLTLNWLPWQGQSMVPLETWFTVHCWCVQIALNP